MKKKGITPELVDEVYQFLMHSIKEDKKEALAKYHRLDKEEKYLKERMKQWKSLRK